MRTTVNLSSEALELCKETARKRRASLGEVISQAILATYREHPPAERREHYELPVSGAGGLRPGVDLDCTSALEDGMEGI